MSVSPVNFSGLSMRDAASVEPMPDRPDAPCSLDRPVKLRITCMNMRHKLMYIDERHTQRGLVDFNSDTRVFWCAKTQEVLGPDGLAVGPGDCSNGRSCYCHGG